MRTALSRSSALTTDPGSIHSFDLLRRFLRRDRHRACQQRKAANIPAFKLTANILLREFRTVRRRNELISRDRYLICDWRIANRQPDVSVDSYRAGQE
jgi:hypothetical protein